MIRTSLAPSPPLDPGLLRPVTVHAEGVGPQEGLVPASDSYRNPDPNAPALVCVPGLGMNGYGYLRQLPLAALADLHFLHNPDDRVPGETGLGEFARCVEGYISTQRLDQRPGGVVLLGSSMGGVVSLSVALRGRVKLRGLILVGTFGSRKHLAWWNKFFAPAAWLIPMPLLRFAAGQIVQRTGLFGHFPPGEARFMLGGIGLRSPKYFGRAVTAATATELIEAARKLSLPTLVVHGTDDRMLPYAAGEELARTIPGARLVSFQGAGHGLFFLNHEAVNAAIAEFLAAL